MYVKCTDSQKEEMRKAYTTLCADETPMVRRSAAMRLKDFVAVLDKQNTITDIIPVYKQLSQDDTQDAIRVACVKVTLVLLSTHFKATPEENKVHTIGVSWISFGTNSMCFYMSILWYTLIIICDLTSKINVLVCIGI